MQGGYLSLLYSTSDKPLEYWSKQKSRTGSIRRVIDKDLNETVLEIQDADEANSPRTWIMCPPEPDQTLNISLPFLVIIMKSLNMQFFLQLQILTKDDTRHLINFSNLDQKKKNISKSAPPTMHLLLEPGWNRLEIDFNNLTKIFDTKFRSLLRLKICANCQIRRIYFVDRHYEDNEMSLGLYQGFLDFYMMKWGIKDVERATQTKKTAGKILPMRDNTLNPTNGLTKLFLRNLQAKSDKIVEEFYSKQSVKSIKDYLDFKRKAKIKPYVIPDCNYFRSSRRSDSSLVDINEFKKNVNQNYLYEKLMVDDKKDANDKIGDTKSNKSNNRQEYKNPIMRIYKYRYPDNLDNKSFNKNNSEKYPHLSKFKLMN